MYCIACSFLLFFFTVKPRNLNKHRFSYKYIPHLFGSPAREVWLSKEAEGEMWGGGGGLLKKTLMGAFFSLTFSYKPPLPPSPPRTANINNLSKRISDLIQKGILQFATENKYHALRGEEEWGGEG